MTRTTALTAVVSASILASFCTMRGMERKDPLRYVTYFNAHREKTYTHAQLACSQLHPYNKSTVSDQFVHAHDQAFGRLAVHLGLLHRQEGWGTLETGQVPLFGDALVKLLAALGVGNGTTEQLVTDKLLEIGIDINRLNAVDETAAGCITKHIDQLKEKASKTVPSYVDSMPSIPAFPQSLHAAKS